MMKTVTGPFAVRRLAAGGCSMSTEAADGPEVLLFGLGAAADLGESGRVERVALAWTQQGVDVALTGPAGVRTLQAATAIVHEPNARLYQSLPLAGFDDEARRFWQRVFRLLRVPGGRWFLGLMARRKQAGRVKSRG